MVQVASAISVALSAYAIVALSGTATVFNVLWHSKEQDHGRSPLETRTGSHPSPAVVPVSTTHVASSAGDSAPKTRDEVLVEWVKEFLPPFLDEILDLYSLQSIFWGVLCTMLSLLELAFCFAVLKLGGSYLLKPSGTSRPTPPRAGIERVPDEVTAPSGMQSEIPMERHEWNENVLRFDIGEFDKNLERLEKAVAKIQERGSSEESAARGRFEAADKVVWFTNFLEKMNSGDRDALRSFPKEKLPRLQDILRKIQTDQLFPEDLCDEVDACEKRTIATQELLLEVNPPPIVR